MRLTIARSDTGLSWSLDTGALTLRREGAYDVEKVAVASAELIELLKRSTQPNTLHLASQERLVEIGSDLYKTLVPEDLREQLGDVAQPVRPALHLEIDSALRDLPWELLYGARGFWCEQFDLGRTIRTTRNLEGVPATFPTTSTPRMLVVCSDPGDLPRATEEGQALVDRLDATRSIEADLVVNPTIVELRQQMGQYDILHYAGHARFDAESAERTGWILADGTFSSDAVLGVAKEARLPSIVFANACQSGRSSQRDDEVDDIAGAFLLGGSRMYIGTIWDVIDKRGLDLALAFYRAITRGASAGMALRVARRDVRQADQGRLTWASYVLYGKPDFTPIRKQEFASREFLTAPDISTVDRPARRSMPMIPATPTGPDRKRSLIVPVLAGVLAAALAGAVLGWIILRDRDLPPPPTPHSNSASRGPLSTERDQHRPPLMLVGFEDRAAYVQCVNGRIESDQRFRIVQGSVNANASDRQIQQVAQAAGAEIAVIASAGQKQIRAMDTLTGDMLVKVPLADDCGNMMGELRRIVHGEGKVTAVRGSGADKRLVVNLGWRSRVAPGAVLRLMRDGKPAGSLTVLRVEMDQSYVRGEAKVGDVVLLPR